MVAHHLGWLENSYDLQEIHGKHQKSFEMMRNQASGLKDLFRHLQSDSEAFLRSSAGRGSSLGFPCCRVCFNGPFVSGARQRLRTAGEIWME